MAMVRKRFDGINVVPFIDIMLVLLTIVLTLATFVAKGIIPVDLPASSSRTQAPMKSVEIAIKADGTLYWGSEAVDVAALESKVATLTENDTVIIRSDKNARFESFITVMDRLKAYHIHKISVVTVTQ
ncbi:MAG: biopolymer transporter ExbD [Campylobacterales bacterium]